MCKVVAEGSGKYSRQAPHEVSLLRTARLSLMALALLTAPISVFTAENVAAQSQLLFPEGLSTVSHLGPVSGAVYADKNLAVNSIVNKCNNRGPANTAQAEFTRFLGGRLSTEEFKRMCRRAKDLSERLKEIDKELLKKSIILGDVRPKEAPRFGDIPGNSE